MPHPLQITRMNFIRLRYLQSELREQHYTPFIQHRHYTLFDTRTYLVSQITEDPPPFLSTD